MLSRLLHLVSTLLLILILEWSCLPKSRSTEVLMRKDRSSRKKYLDGPIMDSVYILFQDDYRSTSYYQEGWPKELLDTLEIYVDSMMLYRGTLNDLYDPYVGTRYAKLKYINSKKQKIATLKLINTRLHKEKSAALLLIEVLSDMGGMYTKMFALWNIENWDDSSIQMLEPYDSKDNRYLFKYLKNDK